MPGFIPPIAREDAIRVQALVRLSHSKRGAEPSAVKARETAEESLKAVSWREFFRVSVSTPQACKLRGIDRGLPTCSELCTPLNIGRALADLVQMICRYFGENIDPSKEEVAKAYCDLFCDVSSFYTSD